MKFITLLMLSIIPLMGSGFTTVDHEGREYVSLDQVADFYRLEHDHEGSLSSTHIKMKFAAGESQAVLSAVKCALIHPVALIDTKLHLSVQDLTNILDPVLRPTKIKLPGAISTIVIDPALEGGDQEDLTLKVALKLREIFQKRGLKAVLTREEKTELPLSERIKLANETGNALYLKIQLPELEKDQGPQVVSLHSPNSKAGLELKQASVGLACAAHWSYLQKRSQSGLAELPDPGFGLATGNDYEALTCPAIEVRVPLSVVVKDGEILAQALADSVVQFKKAVSVK